MLNGQWVGLMEGTNAGFITLNLDFINDSYFGYVVILDQTPTSPRPSLTAKVVFKKIENNKFKGILSDFVPIDRETSLPTSWDSIKKSYQDNITIPFEGVVECIQVSDNRLTGTWQTNVSQGAFELINNPIDYSATIQPTLITWHEFKKIFMADKADGFIFRGQPGLWRLRTSYHRTGRSDFTRYIGNINELNKSLYQHTNHLYDVTNGVEYGALLLLAQHHGYPTPLLDWTLSPFIAAFFAFSFLSENNSYERVRIYKFDSLNWRRNTRQVETIDSLIPSIKPLKLEFPHNSRAMPQQSITTFSNVDDMEWFINFYEQKNTFKYLSIFELSINEKRAVLNDLNTMGIHAGVLFPGLDGTCKMLKDLHFVLRD